MFLNSLFGLNLAGLLLLGHQIINLIATIAQLGINVGVQRFVAIAYGEQDWRKVRGSIFSALQIVVPFTIIISLIVWVFAPEISEIYTKKTANLEYAMQLPTVLRTYSFYLLPSIILAILLASLRALQRIFPTFIIDKIYMPLMWLVLVYVIGISNNINKVSTLIICFSFAVSFGMAMALWFLKKAIPKVKKTVKYHCRKQLFSFSFPLVSKSFLQLFMQVDILMIPIFCSFKMVAVYSSAALLSRQSRVVMAAFSSLFSPMIAAFHSKGDKVALNDLYKTVTRWCMAFALPIIIIVMIMPDLLLKLLAISNSPEGCLTIRLIAFSQIMNVAVGDTGGMLVMTNYPWLTFVNNVGSVIINIILNFILIPKFGIVGAAVATCVSIIFRNIAAVIEVKKLLSMSPFSFSLIKIVFCVFVAGVTVILFRKNISEIKWIMELFYCSFIFAIVYVPTMWFFMDKEDKLFLMKIIKKNEKK